MVIKTKNFSTAELDRFRELQTLSFALLEQAAAELRGGETEKEVAHELVRRYRALGAKAFFHLPVVLFAERTALPGEWPVGKFFPKRAQLQQDSAVILDASPLIDGYLVDTSYSYCFGTNATHAQMMTHLGTYRDDVLQAVLKGETFREIATTVRHSIESSGYEAVHTKHPGEVLGHRAIRTANSPLRPRMQGFDAVSLAWFKMKDSLAMSGLGRRSPLWNELKSSQHTPHAGLWLVEPHAGLGSVGAKWEDILVIERDTAYWLDEQPPHVWQWQQIDAGLPYGPRAQPST